MKKLMAILMGCMLMTGTFASCGSDDDTSESETSAKSSTAEAENGAEDTTDEEEQTTEAATEEDTDEVTTTKKPLPKRLQKPLSPRPVRTLTRPISTAAM